MTRVAVITGASAGIGRAAALEFARRGWRVALLARRSRHLDEAVAESGRLSASLGIPVDVADPDQMEAAAAEVEARWGRIDAWINNAMVTVFAPVDAVAPAELRRVTDVAYHGAVWGTQAALRRMRRLDRGCIVQVGSALAYRSIPLQAAYCAAKSALRGFTDTLRSELIRRRSGIRLTMVHLAAFNTPQFDWAASRCRGWPRPLAPIFQPELAADAIVTAATGRRREWWVGGPAAQAIVGQHLLPHYLDRQLAHSAWDEQFDEDKPVRHREGNLWESMSGDFGTRGRFDREARSFSLQWLLSKHRAVIGLGGAALAVAGVLATALWKRGS